MGYEHGDCMRCYLSGVTDEDNILTEVCFACLGEIFARFKNRSVRQILSETFANADHWGHSTCDFCGSHGCLALTIGVCKECKRDLSDDETTQTIHQ